MTEDKGILIRNVYYMLAYAFQELHMNNYEDIAKEEFEHIQDLFAEILHKGVSMQLKQGLYREYIDKSDNLPLVKGKININGTIKAMMQRKLLICCEFDELSEDNVFNRILKTTMIVLAYNDSVDSKRKAALKSLLPFFNNVETISPLAIQWNTLTYKRNNRNYRMLMNICYFILDGMLLTTESGNYRMTTFSDDHMHRLYERFVLEYYRKHHPYISANSEKLSWDIDEDKPVRGIEFLPLDLYKSHSDRFLQEDGKIRPPLNCLPGVGTAAAKNIVEAREKGEFIAIDDMVKRSGITKAVVEALQGVGCLDGMTETAQLTFFV